MTALTASHLRVRRGAKMILDDVSLTAAAGEFVAVIGPNGAGKSTLLAALAGLWQPDGGTVELDGRSVYQIASRTLAVRRAYLPQNPRCEWPLSVERLVALGLTPILPAIGALPPEHVRRIEQVLSLCDLSEQRLQAVTTLSGGELTRAMLARALVADPQILIADEPIAGLDPRHALDTMRRLAAYARDGRLVIASLHDLTLAARYASRIFALAAGKVTGDGPTAATLTASLLKQTFEVEACVAGEGQARYVDYRSAR
ncbi:MAG TPA: ABC transporter ATP-binding protein [Steroidobacteraceae bacterium]|nr:ABC transporter ATP-binding protein [Steroidobacteraceae bacterium]